MQRKIPFLEQIFAVRIIVYILLYGPKSIMEKKLWEKIYFQYKNSLKKLG